ncbi:MAG: DNA polymerase III subunit gamma/tau [Legionellales bacterium]|nr:DNA polymerase III subunit gamma/tau [Legionellales bacterium]
MTYIALARKWRPRTFSELLGQEHLTRALTQSLTQNRVHHAYLFTGTRGVGKTSVARILAKALNCVQGLTAQPCLQCDNCQAIEQGRFIDLIEIDAASKTRVEDTRELLDNVPYAPTIGRFKVYLIDEVHMLSQHSFNALLKTLEEPPAHVKFLLATTDVQKIPITILSRCIQFHLKPVSEPIITAHLQTILQSEQVEFEPPALDIIAKAARGSMRDALSLLDQSLAGRTDTLTASNVAGLLGQTTEDYALQLLQALCTQDSQQLISISRNIAQTGSPFRYVLDELLAYLHRIAIVQMLPTQPNHAPAYLASPDMTLFAQQLSAEDTQLFYQIGLKGLSDLPFAPTPLIGFEMTLLRMYTFKPAAPAGIPKLAYQHNSPQPIPAIIPVAIAQPILPPLQEPAPLREPPISQPSDWATIIAQLQLSGLALSAMQHSELVDKKGNEIILKVESAHQAIFTKPVIARIQDSLGAYYQETIRLNLQYQQETLDSPATQKKAADIKQQETFTQALQSDPVFQQLQKEFSADLIEDSVDSA